MAPAIIDLDEGQERAVRYLDGPLLVYAGPGAGKTRTLIARTAFLIEQGIRPSGIYLATFTRRARAEMAERLAEALAPSDAELVNVMTLDATAYRILRAVERTRENQGARQCQVADEETLFEHFRAALVLSGFDQHHMPVREAWRAVRGWQARGRDPAWLSAGLEDLARSYAGLMAEARLWDVADLVPAACAALDRQPELAAAFNVQAYLLDEFQDTSRLQFGLIRRLLGPCRSFFAVGAPSQSIYGFRQADCQALVAEMQAHFNGMAVAKLDTNYRCGRPIFEAAAALIPASPDVEGIRSAREDGQVRLVELPDETAEAGYVARACAQLLADHPGLPARQVAVLFRSWAQSHELQHALGQAGLPFQLASRDRLPFWETPEVAALVGYLRAVHSLRAGGGADSRLDGALDVILNAPPRGLGPAARQAILCGDPELTWERLIAALGSGALGSGALGSTALVDTSLQPQARAALQALFELLSDLAHSPLERPDEIAREVLARTGWLEKIGDELEGDTIRTLLEERFPRAAAAYPTLPALLAHAREQMGGRWQVNGITLSTVHAAKGLEWRVVFLVGMNEGVFPAAQAAAGQSAEEEARLAHVAASRAMDVLVCTFTRTRRTKAGSRPVRPSRFLAQIQPFGKEVGDDRLVLPGYNPGAGRAAVFGPGGAAGGETFFGADGGV